MPYVLDYVYPHKAEYIKEARDRFVKKETLSYEQYDDAFILPVINFDKQESKAGQGGVVDKDGHFVELSKALGRITDKYDFTEYDSVNENVVYCGYFYKAWGHFITEVVSRLWYALTNDKTIDSYVFIAQKDEILEFSGNYLEFLKLLGISDKVKIINNPTKFSTVLVPEEGFVYDTYYSNEYRKMYEFVNKNGLAQYKGPKYDKVFFSKRKCEISIISNL